MCSRQKHDQSVAWILATSIRRTANARLSFPRKSAYCVGKFHDDQLSEEFLAHRLLFKCRRLEVFVKLLEFKVHSKNQSAFRGKIHGVLVKIDNIFNCVKYQHAQNRQRLIARLQLSARHKNAHAVVQEKASYLVVYEQQSDGDENEEIKGNLPRAINDPSGICFRCFIMRYGVLVAEKTPSRGKQSI